MSICWYLGDRRLASYLFIGAPPYMSQSLHFIVISLNKVYSFKSPINAQTQKTPPPPPPFSWFSREIFPRLYGQKISPFPKKMGTRMRPSHAFEWGARELKPHLCFHAKVLRRGQTYITNIKLKCIFLLKKGRGIRQKTEAHTPGRAFPF